MRRFIFLFLLVLIIPYSVSAIHLGGLSETATSAGIIGKVANDPFIMASRIIQPVLSLVGVLFFALMIYAGYLWTTAGGDEKKTEKARAILLAAIIGLIIIASAYAITRFAGNSLITTPTN